MCDRVKKYRARRKKLEQLKQLGISVSRNKVKDSNQEVIYQEISHNERSNNSDHFNDTNDERIRHILDNSDSVMNMNDERRYSFDLQLESDEDVSEFDEIKEIRKWIVECRILHLHSDKLLKILRHRLLPTLPKCTKTFLSTTSAVYEVTNMEDSDNSMGQFTYLEIEQGLQDCVNELLHQNHELELLFNIDGMKPYKSSNRTLWPILCKVFYSESDIYKPFTVALYSGTHKPKKLEEYLHKFICEINELLCTAKL